MTRQVRHWKPDQIRAVTSTKYKRYADYRLLDFVKKSLTPDANVGVEMNDQIIGVGIKGVSFQDPADAQSRVGVSMVFTNSEVGFASLATQTILPHVRSPHGAKWTIALPFSVSQ